MRIHKEGKKTLRNQLFIYLIIGIITQFNDNFFFYITPAFLTIFLFFLYFFRNPSRNFEKKDNYIYAPCDGKVVVIEETLENEFFHDKRIQVSIFMSPINIHNNLSPISGKIIYKKYHPGKFLFAWLPKASERNERNTLVIKNNKISILYKQIAGALARRIVSYPKLEENISSCQEIGFIKLGSRVDLYLPINTDLSLKVNDKTIGGQTIIGKY